jgi:hypothetical protein
MISTNYAHDVIIGEKKYAEYAGLSTDTKPTVFGTSYTVVNGERVAHNVGLTTGSLFLEVDTGDVYAYNEAGSDWKKVAELGGSGS